MARRENPGAVAMVCVIFLAIPLIFALGSCETDITDVPANMFKTKSERRFDRELEEAYEREDIRQKHHQEYLDNNPPYQDSSGTWHNID